MARTTVPISGAVLGWARLEAGLTEDELAARTKVTTDVVEAWEANTAKPTRGQFTQLVKALKRPSALFFLPTPPTNAGMPTALRRAPALGTHQLGIEEARQIRWARRLQEAAAWALEDEGAPEVDIAKISMSTDPGAAANETRSRSAITIEEQLAWGSASEAFRSWRSYLEDLDVLVLQLSMGKGNIRGFSAWDNHAPLVAVNTSYHPTARTYTLLHEFAHLITRTDAACQSFVLPGAHDASAERWCEQFAASFLLPTAGLRSVAAKYEITSVTPTGDPDKARLIGNRFSVSARATAIRLENLGLGVKGLYAAVAKQMSHLDWADSTSGGGGGGQPASQRRLGQLGSRIPATLIAAAARGKMNTRDLADHLHLKTGQLEDLKGLLLERQ